MAGVNGSTGQRLQSSFGASSSSFAAQNQELFAVDQGSVPQLQIAQLRGQARHSLPYLGMEDCGKKPGFSPSHPQIPPLSPYSSISANRYLDQQVGLQSFSTIPSPSPTRPVSQTGFFGVDALPPLIPSQYRDSPSNLLDVVSGDVSMEGTDGMANSSLPPSPFTRCSSSRHGESLPPRKAHRRSNSDIPFGFSAAVQSPPPIVPMRNPGVLYKPMIGKDGSESPSVRLSRMESMLERGGDNIADGMGERKTEGEVVDDLFSAYMNLDSIDAFNSSGTDDKLGNDYREDLDSRASGTKTNNSSDNEATSGSVNECGSSKQGYGMPTFSRKREGTKRNAVGDATPLTTRHHRSISMDSFMGKLNFSDESPKMPPSPGMQPAKLSRADSLDSDDNAVSLDFGNGEFSGAEIKRIMANEKLAEIASSDPKRVKRILANRQSAARSKERKMRYIAELEHKVQTLQTEATTLSAQLTLLQRDSAGLTTQNNELKFRLQAMEQQAQLRDALNEALTAEVQRLKLSSAESNGDASKFQQLSISPQMSQLHLEQQQGVQAHVHQLQQQPQANQSNKATKGQ